MLKVKYYWLPDFEKYLSLYLSHSKFLLICPLQFEDYHFAMFKPQQQWEKGDHLHLPIINSKKVTMWLIQTHSVMSIWKRIITILLFWNCEGRYCQSLTVAFSIGQSISNYSEKYIHHNLYGYRRSQWAQVLPCCFVHLFIKHYNMNKDCLKIYNKQPWKPNWQWIHCEKSSTLTASLSHSWCFYLRSNKACCLSSDQCSALLWLLDKPLMLSLQIFVISSVWGD